MTDLATVARRGAGWAIRTAAIVGVASLVVARRGRAPRDPPAGAGPLAHDPVANDPPAGRPPETHVPAGPTVRPALGPTHRPPVQPPLLRSAPAEEARSAEIPTTEPGRYPRGAWLAVAAAAIVGPFLLVILTRPTPPRPFVFELGSALGIAALSLLALQLVLPARLHLLARLGADVAVRLHRHLADVLITVIAAHVAVVMVADPSRLALLSFFGAPWRAQAAVGSVVAILVLAATSILRRRLRLPYAAWRGLHVVLAGVALVFAVVHTVGVGRYLAGGPALVGLAGLTVAGIGAALALRVPRFRRHTVRPYVVERVIREEGGATTLVLAADGHAGQRFAPGQFAWLKQPGVRSSLAEHPFSYSSSAIAPDRPSFTIQPYGGFSREVAAFAPGMRLLVDGPHGAFRLRPAARGAVLVAGGIGITPSMSVLRTAADRRDPRPFLLIYGVKRPDRTVFGSELEHLRSRIDLTILRVVSDPPADWPGERGRITPELLDRWLPGDLRGWQFLVCGPPPFVDASVAALVRVGIPADRVHAERFVGV